MVGSLNNGVKAIAPVLNITRVHSAVHGVGNLARSLLIARSYAAVRRVGSVLLMDMPLHTATLAKVSILYRALLHFTFGVAHLLGKSEAGTASNDENVRLRLLTPIVKGFAAHYAVSGMEECMVALGGQGYMEENEIGRCSVVLLPSNLLPWLTRQST